MTSRPEVEIAYIEAKTEKAIALARFIVKPSKCYNWHCTGNCLSYRGEGKTLSIFYLLWYIYEYRGVSPPPRLGTLLVEVNTTRYQGWTYSVQQLASTYG